MQINVKNSHKQYMSANAEINVWYLLLRWTDMK